MNAIRKWKWALVFVALGLAAAMPFAQNASADDSRAATMTITAVGEKDAAPPAMKREDVQLFLGKERTQVADWKKGGTLYLGIVIDDSLEPNLALQWNDLKAFMMAQPEDTYIAVGYAQNGTVKVAQDFTKDHALAAKALRMPLGYAGAFTSPYLALQDWIKRWPESNERKSILMFSSGIDYFRGAFDPVDPDIDTTIEQAQKKNINIWTIYAQDTGHLGRRTYALFLAQGFLGRVSGESGAESFYLGYIPPVTFKPYFDELQRHLDNQYLLTFVGNGGAKGKFDRVHVTSEVRGVQFLAPSQVFLPPAR
ncbi:MAG TPA: hypothetical protein VE077_01870 [Candidatus Methylomirabilis sp.]|nr:hypothetical protein [Candidatus Methylomirabilis sp.]